MSVELHCVHCGASGESLYKAFGRQLLVDPRALSASYSDAPFSNHVEVQPHICRRCGYVNLFSSRELARIEHERSKQS